MPRRSYRFCLLALALSLAGLATIAGLFARLGRVPALFVHFPVQLLVVASGCALGFALLRRRGLALLALVLASFHASRIAPWYWGSGGKPAPGDWVVVTANVLKDNPLDAPLLDLVARESPDLLVEQEAHADWPGRLDAGLAGAFPFRWTGHGLGVFSRHPVENLRLESVGVPERPVVRFDWCPPGHRVPVVGIHFHTPKAKSWDRRLLEVEGSVRLVKSLSAPVLVLGDLNMSLWDPVYQDFMGGTGLVNTREGRGLVPTRTGKHLRELPETWRPLRWLASIPIDHILHSPGWTVTDLRAGPGIGSDHLPLEARLRLDQEPGSAPEPNPRLVSLWDN